MLFGALLLIQILALSLTSCVTMGELYNMANCCKMAQESPFLCPCPLKNALLSRGRFYLPHPPGSGLALWPALTNKYGRSDTVPVSRLDLRSPECFTQPPGILPPPCEQPRTCLWGDERWHGPVTPVPPDERPEVWVRPWRTPHPQWASSWVQTHE